MNSDPKQRFILMLAIGMTFLLIMQYMFPVKPPPAAPATAQQTVPFQAQPAQPAPSVGAPAADVSFSPDADYRVAVKVGNDGKNGHGYEAIFSSVGGALSTYRFLGYYRQPGDESDDNRVILLDRMAPGRDSLRVDSVTFGHPGQAMTEMRMGGVKFELIEAPSWAEVTPEPPADVVRGDKLVFRTVIGDWELFRTYRFPGEGGDIADFAMTFDLEWRNLADGGRLLSYSLVGPAGMIADDDSPNFGVMNFLSARQPSASSNTVEVERKSLNDVTGAANMMDRDNRAGLAWVGAKNRFFTAIMTTLPEQLSSTNGATRLLFPGDRSYLPVVKDLLENLKHQPQVTTSAGTVPAFEEISLGVVSGTVGAGQSHRASYLLYAGPAVDTWMEEADSRLNGVVSYTISYLDFLSRWLVMLLMFFDGIFGNYGLAIIAATIVIKLLLHPLNRKSFVSMNKMTKLAPMMKEIQKKYAGDRQKMQLEMSKFYKDHGVSMAGGCLPVFLQLPIFFALYGAFSQGFSMRHAAFIPGWIQDLSKPDSVYDLGWSIPLLGSSHISLLPILYLGLQFWQMSLQPKPTDPQQAQQQKIMKIMPLMFVFIFYSMPAGLVLYFTISALCGVAESTWMRKVLLPKLGLGDAPEAKEAAAAQVGAGTGAAAVPSDAKKKRRRR